MPGERLLVQSFLKRRPWLTDAIDALLSDGKTLRGQGSLKVKHNSVPWLPDTSARPVATERVSAATAAECAIRSGTCC